VSTVTKRDLSHQIAVDLGCSRVRASKMLNALFAGMREQLIQGNRIEIRGFGVLSVKNIKPNPTAHNPRTGERISVPARWKAWFKPGLLLKQALRQLPG